MMQPVSHAARFARALALVVGFGLAGCGSSTSADGGAVASDAGTVADAGPCACSCATPAPSGQTSCTGNDATLCCPVVGPLHPPELPA